jgi:pre-mRNA-splicing factor ATP-dependent RNA helicase DHX15/PRP43
MRPKDVAREADEAKAQFSHPDGDHLTLLNAFHAYKQNNDGKEWCYDNFINYRSMQSADNVREQLSRILKKLSLPLVSIPFTDDSYYLNIRKCLAAGLFMQVAHLQRQGHYLTVKDQQVVSIHPSSVINNKPAWVLFQDFVLTTKNYVRSVSAVDIDWLLELSPHYYDLENWPEGETKMEIERTYRRMMQSAAHNKRKK